MYKYTVCVVIYGIGFLSDTIFPNTLFSIISRCQCVYTLLSLFSFYAPPLTILPLFHKTTPHIHPPHSTWYNIPRWFTPQWKYKHFTTTTKLTNKIPHTTTGAPPSKMYSTPRSHIGSVKRGGKWRSHQHNNDSHTTGGSGKKNQLKSLSIQLLCCSYQYILTNYIQ